MLVLCMACVSGVSRAFTGAPLVGDAWRGHLFLGRSGRQWNIPEGSQGLLPRRNPGIKSGSLLARSMTKSPSESLRRGKWFKLICGASNQDMPQIRNLALAYTRKRSSSASHLITLCLACLPALLLLRPIRAANKSCSGAPSRQPSSLRHLEYILTPAALPPPRLLPSPFLGPSPLPSVPFVLDDQSPSCRIIAVAGVDCIDCSADPAVVAAVNEGVDVAMAIGRSGAPGPQVIFRPWIMVSINDDDDPHFRKARFDPKVSFPRPVIERMEAAAPADTFALLCLVPGVPFRL